MWNTAELAAEAAALRQQLDGLVKRVAKATGQPPAQVAADIANGRVLTAEAALDYGLVHQVASTHYDVQHSGSE